MARSNQIVDVLKQKLRSQGINYRQLAKHLKLSESTIKQNFSTKNFSLNRLDKICELLGLELTDLVAAFEKQRPRIEQLSLENEKLLVSDPPLLLVAYCVTSYWSVDEILQNYDISKTDCIRCLAQLDRMKIIELLPENRIKLLIANNFAWHRNGPIEKFFRKEVQGQFLSSSFSADNELRLVKIGDLTEKSIMQLIDRLNNAGDLYDELQSEDRRQAFDSCHGTTMVLAVRKWEFSVFREFEKQH